MKRLLGVLFCTALLIGVLWVPAGAHGNPPDPKVNICHATGSHHNPYRVINVSANGWSGHGGHAGDFLYTGPVDSRGRTDAGWCEDNAPPPPYVQCSETVDQGWAYNGAAFDVGAPVWGDWVDNGDGTSTRIGVQATARHQYRYIVDARDDNVICSSEFRDEAGTREVRESTEPVYGCMDPLALNYNETVTMDDQSCKYPPVCEDGKANNVGEPLPCTYDEPPIIIPPETCEVIGTMWYQCNSGAWLYGTGALRNCPWCGGMNGTRVVKESYDCGETYYRYLNGVPVSAPPQPLGRYSCNTAACFSK